MINHPLFNDDDTNEERASRDIGFINIRQFEGSRSVMLVGQWEPDELLTHDDLYRIAGAGHFELVGRHSRTKRIVDKVLITVKPPRGADPQMPAPAARPEPRAPDPVSMPPAPVMQAGGIVIPPGMDPQTAMMVTMMALSSQQNQAQLQAQREDNRFNASQLTTLMLGFTQSQTQLVTGLASAFGGSAGGAGSGVNTAVDALLKGVEIMSEIRAGIKEGDGEKPTQWNEVTKNIADGIKNIVEVARVANATPPAGPVVPPGGPA